MNSGQPWRLERYNKEEEEEKIEGQVFQSHIVVKKKRYGLRSFGSRA